MDNSLPPFLQHVQLSKKDIRLFEDIMSGWGKVFHEMATMKTWDVEAQRKHLEKMMVYELQHDNRLVILTRLLGRYKMVINSQLQQQMFT